MKAISKYSESASSEERIPVNRKHKFQLNFKLQNFLSLKALIVVGFLIAILPLILGVKFATLAVRETSELGRTMNSEVFEQTKTIRQVLQKASDIERKAKLFVLLSDPSIRQPYELQSYESVRASFKQAMNDLLKLHVDNKIALLINELSEKENLIYQHIISSDTENHPNLPIDEAFQSLRETSTTLSREFEKHVDHQFNEFRTVSEALERKLLEKGILYLAFSVIFILILFIIVSRSIKQLDVSIRRLEAGKLDEPILVSGPMDLCELGKRLDWLRMHMLELEVSKQQFIQNIAREIETPLERASVSAKLLASRTGDRANLTIPEISQSLLGNINKLRIVSDELNRYCQINSEPEIKQLKTVNVKNLLKSILDSYQDQIQSKFIKLKTLVKPVELTGNEQQLQIIIEQLISNTVKFSPPSGEIRIMLRDAGKYMELEIEDEGPGISHDERLKVFEPFYKGKNVANPGEKQSSGMGLTIVKEYIASHHGTIEFLDARDEQQGARVLLKIPFSLNSD